MKSVIEDRDKLMLDAICDTALDAVVAVDHSGIVVAFNKQAEELFGHSKIDAIGQPMAELIIPERYRAAHEAGMQRYVDTGKRKLIGGKVEIEALHAKGHDVPVELGLSILPINDGEVFLSFLRDLTERNQRDAEIVEAREKAERANASKSFVISMLAHDMRTAVGGVTGSLALVDQDGLPVREREVVDAIHSSAHQLRRLLDDTLDFARLEAGEIEVTKAPLRIAELVDELSQSWTPRLRNADMMLQLNCDATAPTVVDMDVARLRQILGNLLANSIKYAAGSDVAVSFTGFGETGLCISVSDTGLGFSEEAISTAFEPFMRPEGQQAKGAGLGLSIVKTLVERLDGRVELKQKDGTGAQIELCFPNCRLDEAPVIVTEDSAVAQFDGIGVLLVEDNATNQLIATRFLEQLGCDVTICRDGESGLQTAESIGFDVILMDIDLPKMNGKDVMRAIRAGNGPNKTAPMIAFTAFAIRSQKDEIIASGADTILAKPILGREDFEVALMTGLRQTPPSADLKVEHGTVVTIDTDRLNSLKETLGAEDFRDLADEFTKDLASLRHDLGNAAGDAESIRSTTHIAVSVTGAIGAQKAQTSAESLNALTHTSSMDGLDESIADLDMALSETMAALGHFLEAS